MWAFEWKLIFMHHTWLWIWCSLSLITGSEWHLCCHSLWDDVVRSYDISPLTFMLHKQPTITKMKGCYCCKKNAVLPQSVENDWLQSPALDKRFWTAPFDGSSGLSFRALFSAVIHIIDAFLSPFVQISS